jgi:hypothetical protein
MMLGVEATGFQLPVIFRGLRAQGQEAQEPPLVPGGFPF